MLGSIETLWRRLLRREDYAVHAHYSGLPSTTPAVQAELFYGRKSTVPAFSFREHESHRVVRMYETDAASRVEAEHVAEGGEPLLEGGSAYADNFTGGAVESHFCPSSMGWGPMLRAANPVVMGAFLLSNLYSFLRVGVPPIEPSDGIMKYGSIQTTASSPCKPISSCAATVSSPQRKKLLRKLARWASACGR